MSMNTLRENDDNEVEAIRPSGEVLEKVPGWSLSEPFRNYEVEVSALASRHDAALVVDSYTSSDCTISQFLDDQKGLYKKASHDYLTDC